MATNDKNYFDPKVLAGIANLGLRARWVVEGLMSGVHKSRRQGVQCRVRRAPRVLARR
jgi:hypothetical protein